MIELKDFQRKASQQIADRLGSYLEDPVPGGTKKNPRVVPFFQELASITASGKTVILADAVQTMGAMMAISPVVLWLSKGRVPVQQAFANLSAGGKYHHLLGAAEIEPLAAYDSHLVKTATKPLVFFATVGTFNQKDKEEGSLRIFRSDLDTAEDSIWDELKLRLDEDNNRRPLVIVYDEGHNMTDQQMGLLLELQPDGLISASATSKLTGRLAQEVKQLQTQAELSDEDMVTLVDAGAVVEAGLIKNTIELRGYQSEMEETIDSLIEDFEAVEDLAQAHGVPAPKAAYVARTNIIEGDGALKDDPKQPFKQRKAPPILIWRYLVEHHGVDPHEIAAYCRLEMKKDFPGPEEFHLFGGGDKDYDEFIAGKFRHVIFNQGLQEGWDDPACYFAYIDKSMESKVQVEQTIGRLLRQPNATHYPAEPLNTAHFYIRVDSKGVFSELLAGVRQKLASEAPKIKIVESSPGTEKPVPVTPKEDRSVFETAQSSAAAAKAIEKIIDELHDYRGDSAGNTESVGSRLIVKRKVDSTDEDADIKWEDFEHANKVNARWLFRREVTRLFPGALRLAPTDDPRFDAKVGFGSKAQTAIDQLAGRVVDAYLENVQLKQKAVDPYWVGPAMVRTSQEISFDNALHPGYSDLGPEELTFALELDKRGLAWVRNPSKSGYGIPLITKGRTQNFYPDFLVWRDDDVLALDTTGPHLLGEKVTRKLLAIRPAKGESGRLVVGFLCKGKFNVEREQIDPKGYSLFGLNPDRTLRVLTFEELPEATDAALEIEAP